MVDAAFLHIKSHIWDAHMSSTLTTIAKRGSYRDASLKQRLALGVIQLTGFVTSTGLFPCDKPFSDIFPGLHSIELHSSLAAGLPHFSVRHFRCWGRDVFLSLPGTYILPSLNGAASTNDFSLTSTDWPMCLPALHRHALLHLLAFASTLRHNRTLMPNLLDSGRFPRYNSRDAVWWWMHSLVAFAKSLPPTYLRALLQMPVPLRFADGWGHEWTHWTEATSYTHCPPLVTLIQDILQGHASGLSTREYGSGPNLDHAMTSPGFDITLAPVYEHSPGFLYGGNRSNCGTWMDKMGDSTTAGTHGIMLASRRHLWQYHVVIAKGRPPLQARWWGSAARHLTFSNCDLFAWIHVMQKVIRLVTPMERVR
jgi:glycogen debranching enzyme